VPDKLAVATWGQKQFADQSQQSLALHRITPENLLKLVKRFDNWRTRLQPIQTAAEITAHIKILPIHQPYLYQKLSQKATQLRLLGMSYQ